jgi:hypothetical protein
MNTRSSTEAELVAADEVVGPMLWTKWFLQAQGYPVCGNTLYQDNRSAMLLESNGRQSAGKRSRHLNIRMFFLTDQVQKGNITIEYCPTDAMTGDYMTKPLHGKKFSSFRSVIMNLPMPAQMMMGVCLMGQTTVGQQECVKSNESKLDLKYPLSIQDLKYLVSDPEEASKDNEEGWILVEAKGKRRSTRSFFRDSRFHPHVGSK